MNDQQRTPAGAVNPYETGHAVRLDEGHHAGTGEFPAIFPNPGLPPHQLRAADVDERAAKRATTQVISMFALSILGTLLFLFSYFAVDGQKLVFVPWFGNIGIQHTLMGLGLGLGLLGIGLGAVHWAKTLMPDTEVVEERHTIRSSDETRQATIDTLNRGKDGAQIGRRPLIAIAGSTALGLFALPPLVQLVGGLGPLGKTGELHDSFWQPGMRLLRDPELTPIRADDLDLGSVYHVLPQYIDTELAALPEKYRQSENGDYRHDQDLGELERKAKAAVLLMRLDENDFQDTDAGRKAKSWGYHGIVAYSKICSHAGCPVGLYEQQTHHLLCPCHQSTFDVTNDCEVVFGPAGHPLPQLKITVDNEGYLIADQGFQEPVGPSFWTRGR